MRSSASTTRNSCVSSSSTCGCWRDGFAQLDAGEIDEFGLDGFIHRYKRAARKLWSFCGSSGSQWLQAATALELMRDSGEEHDWWADSDRSRERF